MNLRKENDMDENERLRQIIADGIEAVRLTREYVDGEPEDSTDGLLPALPGWSWFDWTEKAKEAVAR